jgi:tetratricopeptide (TPR) repeat protein
VAKFPNGANLANVKKYIPSVRANLFNQARQAKNIEEELRLGNDALADNPDDLDYLYLLTIDIRTNEMEASPANYSHAAVASDHAQRAIKLIEAGKPSNVFKPDAAKSVLAYLYQTSAMIEAKNNNQDKAVEYYKKSSASDPANGITNAQNYLALGVIYQTKYAAAAKKFAELPDEKKTNPDDPDHKTALQAVNEQADAVIEAWAHFLAIKESEKYGPTRANVEKALTDLWKFRHDDKTDGLQEYINKFKSSV